MQLDANSLGRLRSQLRLGSVVLFTGAGFAASAKNVLGTPMPSGRSLGEALWKVAFPALTYEQETNLGDVFHAARAKSRTQAWECIRGNLTVDSQSLPASFGRWLSAPWFRWYTLNIDDMETAAQRRFAIPRPVRSISAVTRRVEGGGEGALDVVHLNGALFDSIDEMTFSPGDYAVRLTTPSEWLTTWAADAVARPVVFVGTELDESTLWQYLAYRRLRGDAQNRELRPGSYLITPTLNPARREVLRELNITWIAGTADEFSNEVLAHLEPEIGEGNATLRTAARRDTRRDVPPLVSELVSGQPPVGHEYLSGHEPHWSDLVGGVAAVREIDAVLVQDAHRVLTGEKAISPWLLTGTAGSGKTTSLMRLALALTAEGVPVYWIDSGSNVEPAGVPQTMRSRSGPRVLVIDDADAFGRMAAGWTREVSGDPEVLVVCGVRSSRLGRFMDDLELERAQITQYEMPHLRDGDIEGLLSVLARANRLGELRGLSHADQVRRFANSAGRQLLVAMIEARSGRRFVEKVHEEFVDLSGYAQKAYAVLSLATAMRFSLSKLELLLAIGVQDNDALNAVEGLFARGLIVRDDPSSGYRTRHRVIAEEVVDLLAGDGRVAPALADLAFACAMTIDMTAPRSAPSWRRLIRFLDHDLHLRYAGQDPVQGRTAYARLEPLLNWDYQFWLQRGSLEVEAGDLDLASNFLGQARSLGGDDANVRTECAYLLLKQAARSAGNPAAPGWFDEGKRLLNGLIAERGKRDPYPFHVLGSQGLSWTRAASMSVADRRKLLKELLDTVAAGCGLHPRSNDLRQLRGDLQREWLSTSAS